MCHPSGYPSPFSCQANVLTTILWRQGMSHHIAVNHNNKATMWSWDVLWKPKVLPHTESHCEEDLGLCMFKIGVNLTESGSTHTHRLCRVVHLGEFLTFQLTLEWNSLTHHSWANSTDETDLFGRKHFSLFLWIHFWSYFNSNNYFYYPFYKI